MMEILYVPAWHLSLGHDVAHLGFQAQFLPSAPQTLVKFSNFYLNYFWFTLGVDNFNSNVRIKKNTGVFFVVVDFVLSNFSSNLYSWSSLLKTEIYYGIAPATEKDFKCFGRTDCVTDLSQPRDPSLHRNVCSVQAVAKSGTTERSALELHWRRSCRNTWLGVHRWNALKCYPELLL